MTVLAVMVTLVLVAIDAEVKAAVTAFSLQDPSASVPALVRGLTATRKAIAQFAAEPEAVFILEIKERQFVDAINTALGIDLQALAQPVGSPDGAAMGPVVPGQRIDVRASLTNRAKVNIEPTELSLVNGDAWKSQATGAVPSLLHYRRFGRVKWSPDYARGTTRAPKAANRRAAKSPREGSRAPMETTQSPGLASAA